MSDKADDDFDPYSVKMCAQAGLKSADDEVQKVAEDTPSADAKGNPKKMRAAFLKSKIWPAHTTIKIGFLKEAPENLKRTDIDFMEKTVDQEGNSLKLDPLQKQVGELPVKEAIIKTITERLQPIVNVKLRFYDDNNELYNPNVADIRIDFNRFGGAWSLLGTECLTVKNKAEATMNFGWFDVPTTLHDRQFFGINQEFASGPIKLRVGVSKLQTIILSKDINWMKSMVLRLTVNLLCYISSRVI